MHLTNRFHGLLLASLFIGSTSALAAPPVELEPAPAPHYRQQMQQQLQQRIDQRLEADMTARFDQALDETHGLARSLPRSPTAPPLAQSLSIMPAQPRITGPAQWKQRFRHNGASFI